MGVTEIAELLGVQRSTVEQWGQRSLLPPSDWPVGGRDAWRWGRIRTWAILTGRLAFEPGVARITMPAGMQWEGEPATIIGEREGPDLVPSWVLRIDTPDADGAETVIGKAYARSCLRDDPDFLP